MYECSIYGKRFTAATISSAKRQASIIANRKSNVIDEFSLLSDNGEYIFRRFNRKYPSGQIYFGKWN